MNGFLVMEAAEAKKLREDRWKRQTEPPVIDQKATAKKLRSYMERAGLKPVDIQRYLRLSCVQTVYRWLDGTNIPTVDHLYALSRIFRARTDDMIVFQSTDFDVMPEDQQMLRVWRYGKSWSLKRVGN